MQILWENKLTNGINWETVNHGTKIFPNTSQEVLNPWESIISHNPCFTSSSSLIFSIFYYFFGIFSFLFLFLFFFSFLFWFSASFWIQNTSKPYKYHLSIKDDNFHMKFEHLRNLIKTRICNKLWITSINWEFRITNTSTSKETAFTTKNGITWLKIH